MRHGKTMRPMKKNTGNLKNFSQKKDNDQPEDKEQMILII
jgi:hypothetical protein